MTTWTDIFPDLDGPPVKGLPSEFTTVAGDFTKMHDDATAILEQFSRIMGSGHFDEIQGAVAEPFRAFVDDVADRLKSLPDVSSKAATIFSDHSSKLDGYRTAAQKALSQAITKWGEVKTATTAVSTASTDEQTAKTEAANTPADDPSASDKQTQHTTAQGKLSTAKSNLTSLEGDLKAFRTTWTNLRDDENDLRGTTKHHLDDIDLHDLHDPGWFDSFCEACVGLVKWAYNFTGLEDLVGLIDAIAHGDWAAMLWRLRDLLDKVFVVLSIVALIVCPELLLVILVVIAIAKLGIDIGLYASNTPDPKTGRRISAMDLAFDVFDAVTAGKASQAHEASALARGKEAYSGAKTFAERRSKAIVKDELEDGTAAYTKKNVGRQQKLLRETFGLDSTRTIITRTGKRTVYTVKPTITTRYVIRAGQKVAKPVAVAGYGVDQGKEAAKGPQVEEIEDSMDTDAPRPYFHKPPSGARVLDILSEIPVHK